MSRRPRLTSTFLLGLLGLAAPSPATEPTVHPQVENPVDGLDYHRIGETSSISVLWSEDRIALLVTIPEGLAGAGSYRFVEDTTATEGPRGHGASLVGSLLSPTFVPPLTIGVDGNEIRDLLITFARGRSRFHLAAHGNEKGSWTPARFGERRSDLVYHALGKGCEGEVSATEDELRIEVTVPPGMDGAGTYTCVAEGGSSWLPLASAMSRALFLENADIVIGVDGDRILDLFVTLPGRPFRFQPPEGDPRESRMDR
jgi:hypothetical protein